MKAKLIVEGKEFEIDINHPEIEKLVKPEKKTGYERAKIGEKYWFECANGTINGTTDFQRVVDTEGYWVANYYSNPLIAENNARADRLMRQLRRFAVEHREKELDWEITTKKWFICYSNIELLHAESIFLTKIFNIIYFDSKETTELAIETFHDELIWYFTEYKDSL